MGSTIKGRAYQPKNIGKLVYIDSTFDRVKIYYAHITRAVKLEARLFSF
jgi:hypothetical protein